MFSLLNTEGKARRGEFTCAHGTVQTPVFMKCGYPGGHQGSAERRGSEKHRVSGGIVQYLSPAPAAYRYGCATAGGAAQVYDLGRPDSDGFRRLSGIQPVFSAENQGGGRLLCSHIDGRKIFMGPEESMQIQSNLGSDICMAFDECIENPSPRDYVQKSVDRTYRWLVRCKAENARLNALPDTINREQMLWGINQGGTYADIRRDHMKRIADLDLPGYAMEVSQWGRRRRRCTTSLKPWRSLCPGENPVPDGRGHSNQHH